MNGIYLFAAALGVPLVAWFLLSGGDDGGGEGGDGGGGDDGIGGLMLRLFPLSTIAIAVATFGVTGLLLRAADTGSSTTLIGALAVAAIAGVLNSTVFAYVRRSDSTSSARDDQLVGARGRVVLPMADGRRGRVAVSLGDQELYLSARALPEAEADRQSAPALEVGAPVLVVEVRNGIAAVIRLDPELI